MPRPWDGRLRPASHSSCWMQVRPRAEQKRPSFASPPQGAALSWLLVHTRFTLRQATFCYRDNDGVDFNKKGRV
jgi:hypothetical protein